MALGCQGLGTKQLRTLPQGGVGDSEWDLVRTEDQVPEYALLSY